MDSRLHRLRCVDRQRREAIDRRCGLAGDRKLCKEPDATITMPEQALDAAGALNWIPATLTSAIEHPLMIDAFCE